jgi:4-hydroxybenzoate 3-monooxygenase
VHRGLELRFEGRGHRIALSELTGGRAITVYGQQEVVKDLIRARVEAGGRILFEVADVSLHDLTTASPAVRFRHAGREHELRCDVVAGCDGFHGVCRGAIPAGRIRFYEREYPFAWLGILAAVAPSTEELIYAYHERGFALHSLRSPAISRFYLQCRPDEALADWPDERIWRELGRRLATDDGWALSAGPILERGITPMRSFVAEPMQYGRLFLAGDAAHIVPPLPLLQTDVVLRQGRRGGRRTAEVAQLGQLQAVLEAVVPVVAVQHRRHPPGEVLGPPSSGSRWEILCHGGRRWRLKSRLPAAGHEAPLRGLGLTRARRP